MQPEARDWQGVARAYVRAADGRRSPRLRALVAPAELALDLAGVRAAWGSPVPDADSRTWVRGVWQVPPATRLSGWFAGEPRFEAAPPRGARDLDGALRAAVAAVAAPDPVLALGGGLDAALVLALWRDAGRPPPPLLTLHTDAPDYDESERAARVASSFGAQVVRVRVAMDDLVATLPEAIAAIEQPLYNLHPVSRLLLARAAARLGARTLITGDGADQLCAGCAALDYLPLMGALTEDAGLELWSPFFDEGVIASALAAGPDPRKAALRALARSAGVPAWIVEAAKVSRYAPRLDLSAYIDRRELGDLADELGLPLSLATGAQEVGWVTLALACRWLRAPQASPVTPCAE